MIYRGTWGWILRRHRAQIIDYREVFFRLQRNRMTDMVTIIKLSASQMPSSASKPPVLDRYEQQVGVEQTG